MFSVLKSVGLRATCLPPIPTRTFATFASLSRIRSFTSPTFLVLDVVHRPADHPRRADLIRLDAFDVIGVGLSGVSRLSVAFPGERRASVRKREQLLEGASPSFTSGQSGRPSVFHEHSSKRRIP